MPGIKTDPKQRSDQPKPSEQHEGLPGLFDPTTLPAVESDPDARSEPRQEPEETTKKRPPAAQTAGDL